MKLSDEKKLSFYILLHTSTIVGGVKAKYIDRVAHFTNLAHITSMAYTTTFITHPTHHPHHHHTTHPCTHTPCHAPTHTMHYLPKITLHPNQSLFPLIRTSPLTSSRQTSKQLNSFHKYDFQNTNPMVWYWLTQQPSWSFHRVV